MTRSIARLKRELAAKGAAYGVRAKTYVQSPYRRATLPTSGNVSTKRCPNRQGSSIDFGNLLTYLPNGPNTGGDPVRRALLRRVAIVGAVGAAAVTPLVGAGSAKAVDLTLPSLWQSYQNDFTIGTFGNWNRKALTLSSAIFFCASPSAALYASRSGAEVTLA